MDRKQPVAVNEIAKKMPASYSAAWSPRKTRPWYRKSGLLAGVIGIPVVLAGVAWSMRIFIFPVEPATKTMIPPQSLPTTEPTLPSPNQTPLVDPPPDPLEVAPLRFNPARQ
jgi:hypothetical protein